MYEITRFVKCESDGYLSFDLIYFVLLNVYENYYPEVQKPEKQKEKTSRMKPQSLNAIHIYRRECV